MSTFRHSLILYISIFFIFLLVVINSLFFVQYDLESAQNRENILKRFHESGKILDISRIEGVPFEDAKKRLYEILGVNLLREKDAEIGKRGDLVFENREIKIYKYDDFYWFFLDDKRRGVKSFLSTQAKKEILPRILLFAFVVDFSIIIFFIYVIKRVFPLRTLRKTIKEFSKGNLDISSNISGKDEIADLSMEFNEAIKKIKNLQESRNLFLRNIMHELKTPIAKGKLSSEMIDDEKSKERLIKIFARLDLLLNEFAKLEMITSGTFSLNKRTFRVVDIIDNAIDLLMLDEDLVEVEVEENLEVFVDFDLFSIVLKNLIDNAIKYGMGRAKVVIRRDSISILSIGEKLDNTSFDKPFSRKYEGGSKGLGLGLYIVKSVVEKHGYNLKYRHIDGVNNFEISIY